MNAPRLVEDVSDTARWVAHFRALESERRDALFHDPHARRLAGDRGRAIAERLPKGPLSWSLAVRTRVFDDLILEAVQGGEVQTVLNLAAGLDARPYRLPIPHTVRWVEVDLPGIVAWKNEILERERPVCAIERISLDLLDRDAPKELLARVGAGGARVLVVTEGVLVYFDDAEVGALADDLCRALPMGLWLLECMSPSVLARQRRRWGKKLRAASAEHKFAPAEGLEFFRPYGWAPRMTKSLLDEAQRLGREMRLVALIRFVESLLPPLKTVYARRQAQFRNAMVYAIMQRGDGSPEYPKNLDRTRRQLQSHRLARSPEQNRLEPGS
jgi:methyltransferase (TIGR00027 family)